MTRNTSGEWWLSKKWGYAASVALIPYAILKTLWAFGVPLLVSENGVEALHASMRTNADQVSRFLYSYGVDLTVILAIIASLLALALVRPWGVIIPKRLPGIGGRKVPGWLLLIPAWLGGLTFTSVCIVTFYKLIVGSIRLSDIQDFEPGVIIPVYGGFFIWGVTISLAALSYQIRTRGHGHSR
ncbi:hypothetical protein [Bacillus sp. XF8]|uniref:hypothetical protein n=1 Tax=Bacillus sp. XF8 TaxID=2819289 RepID=UPI001AA013C5|nr:hypothetical protein [Bacillus sp. XF8]MBO1581912.1 hypothetical protein [Bacillus sp. XF8]